MKTWTIKVTYTIITKHSCNCEFCELEFSAPSGFGEEYVKTIVVKAVSWDDATAQVLDKLNGGAKEVRYSLVSIEE